MHQQQSIARSNDHSGQVSRAPAFALISYTYLLVNLSYVPGCVPSPCGDKFYLFHIVGEVRDVQTGDPLSDASVGVQLLANGQVVARRVAEAGDAVVTGADGTFDQRVSYSVGNCNLTLPGVSPTPLPDLAPDEVEVIVNRDGCETVFTFDVNNDNFVDATASEQVLQLRDPILVPACIDDEADS